MGPPNPWFDYYNYFPPSPTISIEMDPNWRRDLNLEDEEIERIFDLQLDDLQDIEDLFPSSYKESLVDDDVSDFDVHGPFSRMWICHSL